MWQYLPVFEPPLVSSILQSFSIVVTGLIAGITMFLAMRSEIRILRHDVSRIEQGQTALSEAFKQLGAILTQVAVQDTRISMMEKSIDELRHGSGFITKDG